MQEQAREAERQPAAAKTGATEGASEAERERVAGSEREAKASFKAIQGMDLKGEAKLEETPEGVKVRVEVENAPSGKKGIHVHEKGDCSNIEKESMGTHFAPQGKSHGLPGAPEHHLGDLGNIQIDADGNGKLEMTVKGANLKKGDRLSFIGRALVIHASDDRGVQPTGGAGKPIACAVIVED